MNLTLELTTEQVIDLVQQMSPEEKFLVVRALAKETQAERKERMEYAESKVRQLCAERGLDWDAMTDEERLYFIDDIVHEDRECSR
ncbi:hypothetical protein C6496_17735 [Candidatus Poribacteria bacterium]|nr:MAG: hypothetical protein C6496_17735 [Candidatus Poribacteria bacterium]